MWGFGKSQKHKIANGGRGLAHIAMGSGKEGASQTSVVIRQRHGIGLGEWCSSGENQVSDRAQSPHINHVSVSSLAAVVSVAIVISQYFRRFMCRYFAPEGGYKRILCWAGVTYTHLSEARKLDCHWRGRCDKYVLIQRNS